jgi:hypothetical protein
MNQYKPGDRVKIISMEKIRSYPDEGDGYYRFPLLYWIPPMNYFAGTIQEISAIVEGGYNLKRDPKPFTFTPEMIEGPADPVEQQTNTGYIEATIHNVEGDWFAYETTYNRSPLDTESENLVKRNLDSFEKKRIRGFKKNGFFHISVEQEGQEELWREVFNPPTVHGSYLKELLDKYTITRKNTPQ